MFAGPATMMVQKDTSYLDSLLLDDDGFCRLLPYSEIASIEHVDFMQWCHARAVYQYPTVELIEFLKRTIDGRSAIEVASGTGQIGRHLGIRMTDSHMQLEPDIRAYYIALGQVPITYPPSVENVDANEAVIRYAPDVVVACWLTHKFLPNTGMTQGSAMGADEEHIIRSVETYIHVGNDGSHSQKPALQLPHQKEYFPWLASRAADPSKNHVLVWGGK